MRLGHVRKFISLPPVDVHELYIGGLDSNRHAWQVKEGHGPKSKAAVVGMKDDDTDMATTKVVETTDKETLQGFVRNLYTSLVKPSFTTWLA